jgi:hypothetical protein
MLRNLNISLWGLATGAALLAQTPSLEPVHQAELAFARLAGQQGIRTAFRTWLTDDAYVFTPRMVSAKVQYGPEPGDPGYLAWYPEAMGLAASGDLAWSLGPWTYAVKKGEAILVNGHFLSIWRKIEGRWKVVADIGVPHAAPERPIPAFIVEGTVSTIGKPAVANSEALPALRKLEGDLSKAWAAKGGSSLTPLLAKEARLLRPRCLPLRQEGDINKALEADRPGSTWEPARLQVASSGDLAWTCGETGPDDRGRTASFLRIWTLEAGAWKVLFDVRLPHPAPPK